MTTILAAVSLCALLKWDHNGKDLSGQAEEVVASEVEIVDVGSGQVVATAFGGPNSCGIGDFGEWVDGSGYRIRARVADAAGNWSDWSAQIEVTAFIRGDANSDGEVNIADTVALLVAFFGGGPLGCLDAADANDDGVVDIADPIRILLAMFGTAGIPEPFPLAGIDFTNDAIECSL